MPTNWFKGKTIIVPIDYSDASREAIRLAEQVADDVTRIRAIHVIPEINDPYVTFIDETLDVELKTRTKDEFLKWLSNMHSKVGDVEIRVGDPGLTIADFADEQENPLIIIPSHGRTGVTRILLGSVAERVVRYAHCPVIVLKHKKETKKKKQAALAEKVDTSTMRPDDLLVVYTTNDPSDAEIIRNALQAEGIKCAIDGESQAGFTGVVNFPIKLLVRAEDYDRAYKYIETHH